MKNGKKSKSKKKKIIIIVIVALVLGAAAWFLFGGGGGPEGLPVTTGTAEYTDLEKVVAIKGTVQGSELANVASILDYKVTSVLVEEGDRVEQGQVLATLDVDELDTSAEDTARKQAQITLAEAKRVYDNNKTLYEAGAISESDYLQAKSAYESAEVVANAPRSKSRTEDSQIVSPIAGVVTRVNINVGRYASDTVDKAPMFVVEDLDNLQMKVSVGEYDISSIRLGQRAEITAEVLGDQSVSGVVSYISPTGESKGDGTPAMVIPVTIDIDRGDSNLIAGVTARAEILVDSRERVMTVPIDAVLEDPLTEEKFVFVVGEGNLLKKVTVETGLEGDFNLEITGGDLAEGDRLVLNPNFEMMDGMAVLPDLDATAEAGGAGETEADAE